MQPVNLFEVAAQQARWLTVRQTTVASNVANANTPNYRALDVEPFESVLKNTNISMRTTNARHISLGMTRDNLAVRQTDADTPISPSGNSVVLETELMKAGEVRRDYELNSAIVKSFHRMLMQTTRS
ncbi:flagellar basal body rod protein FlgB [Aquamicrobium sp. LC103]|uniref:flagellar basal body rod protein FlgB n=1 Tax=Aquamicrobium sp. LC103 TaxID=1120658 RepID=UPI00063E72E4|nr:flagellar basal body rod protein FlgB [Aquamicrobium sp. LC103]TKT77480.1 flagellar basal body rod protein FlgB [Aquamicrobium sp. LC103]